MSHTPSNQQQSEKIRGTQAKNSVVVIKSRRAW